MFRFIQGLLEPLLMQRRAGIGQLHQLIIIAQGRCGGETFRRSPRFDARAAPTRLNQPDGDPQLLVQFAAEIIGGGRKPAPTSFGHGFGRADLPFAFDIGLRQRRPICGSPAAGEGRD
jgi:hypothetical protein